MSKELRKLDNERLYNIVVAVGALLGQGYPTHGEACWYCSAGPARAHFKGCQWQELSDAYNLRLGLPDEPER